MLFPAPLPTRRLCHQLMVPGIQGSLNAQDVAMAMWAHGAPTEGGRRKSGAPPGGGG